jgi:hypothetical protein
MHAEYATKYPVRKPRKRKKRYIKMTHWEIVCENTGVDVTSSLSCPVSSLYY